MTYIMGETVRCRPLPSLQDSNRRKSLFNLLGCGGCLLSVSLHLWFWLNISKEGSPLPITYRLLIDGFSLSSNHGLFEHGVYHVRFFLFQEQSLFLFYHVH